jgi:uncharacterized protein YjbI with pentapeptide repeats
MAHGDIKRKGSGKYFLSEGHHMGLSGYRANLAGADLTGVDLTGVTLGDVTIVTGALLFLSRSDD